MLPLLNMNASSTDVGKQITAIKSYINSLKDSIDDELSHISYEQLDGNLRKKIDSINDAVKLAEEKADDVAGTVKANYVTANEVAATYITANQVAANYATIGAVNANTARISTIESNYVGTNYLEANYATIGALGAATARIGTIEANYLTANSITADFINSKYQGATGFSAQRIYCDSYHVNAEGQSYALSPTRITVGSRSLIVIGG